MPKVTGTETTTEQRKTEHLRINLEKDVQFPHLTTGLEDYRFMHEALPELDLNEIDTSTEVFGKRLKAPILISSMTGGSQEAQRYNYRLAEAAQTMGVAMGLGSQRAAIEREDLSDTYNIRHLAPDILLFANVGAVQLNYGYGVAQCRRAVDMVQANALILHFNALQEAVQPEGDGNFKGLLAKVEQVCRQVEPVPVIAKEVGWGFSQRSARLLAEAGVKAIDVAGAGGTSWSEVEYHRAPTAFHARVARSFADWGIPTAESIQYVRTAAPQVMIIASGGLRDGIDIAKCIALGATLGGMAGPFLKAADESTDEVVMLIKELERQIRVTMFVTGSKDIRALAQAALIREN
ncbi:MAG TPA: type 2 isopentenyl-diphosphate Delta-isomerase [Aggregatilineales bacterium]|nr:type 2 isopentenyl-diphosphate Delta-isomerase [Aggregatilineales bacterium]